MKLNTKTGPVLLAFSLMTLGQIRLSRTTGVTDMNAPPSPLSNRWLRKKSMMITTPGPVRCDSNWPPDAMNTMPC